MILQRRIVHRRRQDGNTRVYLAGTDITETVPSGVANCFISIYGGGGGGGKATLFGGGGGGGAYCTKLVAVSPGNTFIFTVGAGGLGKTGTTGAGANAGNTVVTGNVTGGSVDMFAGGGKGGLLSSSPGVGGIATGGDTNNPGANGSSQLGGDGSGPLGGAGGIKWANDDPTPPTLATEFGGGGYGNILGQSGGVGTDGKGGMVMFDYTL